MPFIHRVQHFCLTSSSSLTSRLPRLITFSYSRPPLLLLLSFSPIACVCGTSCLTHVSLPRTSLLLDTPFPVPRSLCFPPSPLLLFFRAYLTRSTRRLRAVLSQRVSRAAAACRARALRRSVVASARRAPVPCCPSPRGLALSPRCTAALLCKKFTGWVGGRPMSRSGVSACMPIGHDVRGFIAELRRKHHLPTAS